MNRLERRDALVLLVYALVVAVLLGTIVPSQGLAGGALFWPRHATIAVVAVGAVALLWRRRAPVVTLVVTGAASVAELFLGGNVAAYVLLFDALWSPVVHGGIRLARLTTVCGVVLALSIIGVVTSPQLGWSSDLGFSLVLGLLLVSVAIVSPLIWGWEVRHHRTARLTAERLVDTQRELSAERAARAVDVERGRIAQDLHDLVAGHLSAVTLHTSLAATLADEDSRGRSLATARESAQAALRDLRSVILMLSDRDAHDLAAPTLDWTTLSDRLAAGDEPAEVHIEAGVEDPDRVDPLMRAVLLRIASEAVTNATRHGAAPRSLDVTLRNDTVTLACRNHMPANLVPGDRSPRRGTGLGLAAMRHQAAAVGGSFDGGPEGTNQWLVQAHLPLRRTADDSGHATTDEELL